MKSFLYLLLWFLTSPVLAQYGRLTANKSSNAYRNNYQRMASGSSSNSTFEIRNGTLWAWGNNLYGQLGGGPNFNRISPIRIGTATNWMGIATGLSHTVGIRSDGTLWAWGRNNYGQLGDGTNTDRTSPVQIGTATNWVGIAAGGNHTLGLRSDGTLWAWGDNQYGQVGDGTITNQNSPVQIGTATNWVGIAAGAGHTVGIRNDGTLWAWGRNNSGQVGDGTTTNANTPVRIGTATNWVGIAAGQYHTVGLRSDGTLWAWGRNSSGQVGDGTTTFVRDSPVQSGTATNWVGITAGGNHTLGLRSDGSLWAWGENSAGQLGDDTNTDRNSPVRIGTDANWVGIAAGEDHTLGLRSDGTLWAWGYNSSGQLGDGTSTIQRTSPLQISTLTNWVSGAVGQSHTQGLRSDGTLWAWGDNQYGQLGDGTNTNRTSPVRIGTATNWVGIATGQYHTVGLRSDGTVWAWGRNDFSQLGDGTNTDRTSPVQSGTATNWVSIATGAVHTVGLRSDGTLWAWGDNNLGQLGDGTNTRRTSPVRVGTATNWVSIAAGALHTVGLRSDGTLWVWGTNSSGQLGDGSTTARNSPVQIGTATNWVGIAAGGSHTVGLRSDGTLWAWGFNGTGQLGDGSTTQRNSPVRIGTETNWVGIAAGITHTVGLRSDGTLWAWGMNGAGQLGDGSNTQRNNPIAISLSGTGISLFRGSQSNHSALIQNTRQTLCLTGSNTNGQLGNGTTTNTNTFDCTVSVTSPPTIAGFNVTPNPVCTGSVATFTASVGNVTTPFPFTLTNGIGTVSGNSSSTALSQAWTAVGSGPQSFTLRVGSGASLTAVTTTLTVASLPTVLITTPNNTTTLTCTTPTLTLTANGGTTYRWDNNAATATRTVSASGTYSVTVTNASNCTAASSQIVRSATATVTVTNPATNTATLGVSFNQTFTSTSTGVASRTFVLAGGTLPTGLTLNAAGVLSGTPTQSGSFTVTVRATDVNGCSAVGPSYVLTVNNPTPTLAGFAATSASACIGNVATFTATVGNVSGMYTFTLTNGSSTTTGTRTSTAFSQSWTAAGSGTQNFTLTVSAGGFATTALTPLSINALPVAGISVPSGVTLLSCATTAITLSATGAGTGGSYRWSNGFNGVTNNVATVGPHSVTVTTAAGCTAVTSRSLGSDYTVPAISLTATNACAGQSVTLTATPGLVGYQFYTSSSSIATGITSTTAITGLAANTYSFTVLARHPTSLCSNTAVATATVNALPSLTLTARNSVGAVSNTLTCASPSLTLTASGATSYTFAGTGLIASGASATVSQAGTFTLTGRNASGCQSTTTITIQSNTATVSVSSPSINTALAGVAFSQNFGASGGQATYSFTVASGLLPNGLSLSTSGVLSGTPTQTGTFNVSVRGTDANGCSGLSSVYSLAIQSTDVGSLSVTPNAVCAGERVTFAASVSGTSGTYNFTLTNGSSQTVNSSSVRPFSQSWTAAGSGLQTFTLIIEDNGTFDQTTNTLTVNPLPTAGISVPANLTLTCASPTLTLTATGGTSYRWEDNSINAQRSINATGTYTVTVTNGSGCTAVASQSVTVSQNSTLPGVSLSAANVCEGASVSLVATSGLSSYTFIGSAGVLDSGTDPTAPADRLEVTGLLAGVYSFTVRVINGAGCVNTATTSVTVHAPPTPTLVASHSGLLTCARTSLTLTATGGNQYAFGGTGLQSQTPTAGTVVVNQTGLYSVTVTNTATGCFSTTDISINSDVVPPTVTISPDSGTLTCASPTLTLTATGGISYTWTGGIIGETLPVSASGVYSVTATGTNGCTALASVSIDQDADLPAASLVASGTLTCAQTIIELTAGAGGLVSVSYVFAGPTGGGASGIVTQNSATGMADVNRSGVYSVTVTNTITGCSSATSTSVSQDTAAPSVNVSPASATLTCAIQVVSLTASGGLSGDSYLWSDGSTDPIVSIGSPGTYSVVLTAANGCTASASAVVGQSAGVPTAGLVVSGTITCAIPSVTLTATGGSGLPGDTYAFFGPEIISQDPTAGTAVVGAGGSYGVVISNTATGCSSNTLIEVFQNTTLPTVSIGASHTVLTCAQTSLTLTAAGNGASYVWTGGVTGTTLVVRANGTYSVTAISANGCTTVADLEVTDDLTPPTSPQLLANPNTLLTCAQTSVTLTASADGNGISYVFAGPGGPLSGGSGLPVGDTRVVSASGTYSMIATGSNGCTATATESISEDTAAPSLTITPNSGTLTCASPTLTLTATGGAGLYTWSDGSTGETLPVSASGIYSVTATGANGCTAVTSVSISQSAGLPVAGLVASGTLTCAQTSVTLTATGGNTGATLAYIFSGPGIVSQNASAGTAVVNAAGPYSVTVTNTTTGCSSVTSVTVNSDTTSPTVSIGVTGTLTCSVQALTLTATASATALRWTGGSTGTTLVVNTHGIYSVTATAANGCTAVATSVTVSQNTATPSPSISPTSATLTCASPTLTLTATGGMSYTWTGGTTGNTLPLSASGVYSVTATGANGCTGVAPSVTVSQNTAAPLVSINPTSATLTCVSPTLTLTATAMGSLRWTGGSTGNTLPVSASGTYSVTATGANGCTQVASVNVSSNLIGSGATASLGSTASVVCEGGNVLVTATVSGTPTAMQWYRNGQPLTGQTSATLSLGGLISTQSGSYVLSLTSGCGNGASQPFNLTVNPLPTVTLAVPQGTTVAGPGTGVATLTVAPPLTGIVMQVFGGSQYERLIIMDRVNGFEIRQVDTNANGIFTINRTGPFRLTVTGANGCQRTVEGVVRTQ